MGEDGPLHIPPLFSPSLSWLLLVSLVSVRWYVANFGFDIADILRRR